jgi:hypothetical protein
MNVANTGLKVLNHILERGVRWGIIERNVIRKEAAHRGEHDGLWNQTSTTP